MSTEEAEIEAEIETESAEIEAESTEKDSEAESVRKCVARFEYIAQDDKEIDFDKGDILDLLDTTGIWYKIRNSSGKEGLIPRNFVKEIFPERNQSNELDGLEEPDAPTGRLGGPTLNIKAIVRYPYDSTRKDELALKKDEVVVILEKESDGWWRGRNEEEVMGWFPFNYVEEIYDGTSVPPEENPDGSEERTEEVYDYK